jgi:hypothetical protein
MLFQRSPIPTPPIPYPPTPPFWPWRSPVLGHIQFASPMGLSLQWWPTRPSFDTYAAKDKSSRVLVSSYCCSTYRVAVPYSSLGTFSSSSIGGPVIHPIADCEHPLLCLLGPGIVSQETTISGSFRGSCTIEVIHLYQSHYCCLNVSSNICQMELNSIVQLCVGDNENYISL